MNLGFLSRRRSHLEYTGANGVRGSFYIPEYTTGQEVLRSPKDLGKAVTTPKLLWDTAKSVCLSSAYCLLDKNVLGISYVPSRDLKANSPLLSSSHYEAWPLCKCLNKN